MIVFTRRVTIESAGSGEWKQVCVIVLDLEQDPAPFNHEAGAVVLGCRLGEVTDLLFVTRGFARHAAVAECLDPMGASILRRQP